MYVNLISEGKGFFFAVHKVQIFFWREDYTVLFPWIFHFDLSQMGRHLFSFSPCSSAISVISPAPGTALSMGNSGVLCCVFFWECEIFRGAKENIYKEASRISPQELACSHVSNLFLKHPLNFPKEEVNGHLPSCDKPLILPPWWLSSLLSLKLLPQISSVKDSLE